VTVNGVHAPKTPPQLLSASSGAGKAGRRAPKALPLPKGRKSHALPQRHDGKLEKMPDLIRDKIGRIESPFAIQEEARRGLILKIQNSAHCDVAVLYHNLECPHSILDDGDAEMLEGVLSANRPKRPLLLIINSNGGLPLAAERLVHVARSYAPKGFRTMVVQKAKSAATMICLGSDQIYMTKTSELGPIDPQILGFDKSQRISVDSYLGAYDKLMSDVRALDMNEENPSGLLHRLNRFDAAHVEEMRKVRELGRDMAEKFLNEFMLKGTEKEKIDEVVQAFCESAKHKSHGRPIWASEAKALGLNITIMNPTSVIWKSSYELIQRYDHLCMLRQLSDSE